MTDPPTIQDNALAAAIRACGANRTEEIIKLDVRSRGIKNLSGIEDLVNLRHLNLGRNRISDLAPLSGLGKMTSLFLEHSNIQAISPLKRLRLFPTCRQE